MVFDNRLLRPKLFQIGIFLGRASEKVRHQRFGTSEEMGRGFESMEQYPTCDPYDERRTSRISARFDFGFAQTAIVL